MYAAQEPARAGEKNRPEPATEEAELTTCNHPRMTEEEAEACCSNFIAAKHHAERYRTRLSLA